MTHRERFRNVFTCKPVDRIPIYCFGMWKETLERWRAEGFSDDGDKSYHNPRVEGMDPDWETGLWNVQGLVKTYAIGDIEPAVLEDRGDTRIVRNALGGVSLVRTDGSSIAHEITYPLKPTRESWNDFKRFLDPTSAGRYAPGWREKALWLNAQDRVTTFMGGSFYGWIREWMGVENLSYLMYDDPALFEEMVSHITDSFLALMEPVLREVTFDFVYFFEDCCGSYGPLFSPEIYRRILHPYYRKLITFYKNHGVPLALIDSDGKSEKLIPCWLESGFDIIFPIEVGKWNANPTDLRRQFGRDLRMFGGVDKNRIYGPPGLLREHLISLKPEVDAGGYLPIPDHRIPPQVSYQQMLDYVQMFREVFNGN